MLVLRKMLRTYYMNDPYGKSQFGKFTQFETPLIINAKVINITVKNDNKPWKGMIHLPQRIHMEYREIL